MLPEEILLFIFSFLSPGNLLKCAIVCKAFGRISNDPVLWKKIGTLRFGKVSSRAYICWLEKIGKLYCRCSIEKLGQNGEILTLWSDNHILDVLTKDYPIPGIVFSGENIGQFHSFAQKKHSCYTRKSSFRLTYINPVDDKSPYYPRTRRGKSYIKSDLRMFAIIVIPSSGDWRAFVYKCLSMLEHADWIQVFCYLTAEKNIKRKEEMKNWLGKRRDGMFSFLLDVSEMDCMFRLIGRNVLREDLSCGSNFYIKKIPSLEWVKKAGKAYNSRKNKYEKCLLQ